VHGFHRISIERFTLGAFNTLHLEAPCPNCRRVVALAVQFKYGDCWQHEYKLGDTLRWGGNDVGRPGASRVVVSGASESCPLCGSDGEFYVFVFEGRLASVEPASGLYDFVRSHETFLVLDP